MTEAKGNLDSELHVLISYLLLSHKPCVNALLLSMQFIQHSSRGDNLANMSREKEV